MLNAEAVIGMRLSTKLMLSSAFSPSAKLKFKPAWVIRRGFYSLIKKATKSEYEIKEDKKAKESNEINNVEQTIDELIAADVEALEVLNQVSVQEIDQNLYDEIKVLNIKLKVIDIENIK